MTVAPMCWSMEASLAVAAVGATATVITARRGEPVAIWGTIGFFTAMELLQAASYPVLDQCGSSANRTLAILSYLHIAAQPVVINIFLMAIAPVAVSAAMRRRVLAWAGLASFLLLLRLVPFQSLGPCLDNEIMCGPDFCVLSGSWHLAWQVPMNDLWGPLRWLFGHPFQLIDYMLAVFILPLFYGQWRFVLFHIFAGPVLVSMLTSTPDEIPAVWCLLSLGIVLIGLSPMIRKRVFRSQDTVRT